MIIEYALHDISLSDDEAKALIERAAALSPSSISVLYPYLKVAKSLLSSSPGIKLASVVDYPLGSTDSRNRALHIETAIKSGAQVISIVAQPYYFCNRKYDKFKEDIHSNLAICSKYEVELRYILEYRVFTYDLLYKVAKILLAENILNIYPSTGYLLDDIHDNILASALINKKVPINIICNGNVWNIDQINNIKKANLYGLQVNSINALEILNKNNINS